MNKLISTTLNKEGHRFNISSKLDEEYIRVSVECYEEIANISKKSANAINEYLHASQNAKMLLNGKIDNEGLFVCASVKVKQNTPTLFLKTIIDSLLCAALHHAQFCNLVIVNNN